MACQRLPRARSLFLLCLGLTAAGCSQGPAGERVGKAPAEPGPAASEGLSRESQTPRAEAAPARAGQRIELPPPYHTRSVDNHPRVVPRPQGARLTLPAGFRIQVFAAGLVNPREMSVAPNGDLLVSESRANRVRLLRDADGDGKPEVSRVFASGLRQPFGIAFRPGYVYIANTNALVRFPYKPDQLSVSGQPEVITRLPGGGYNQHWTRNVVAHPKTGKLYVSVGSQGNTAVEPPPRASILELNPDGSGRRLYATGLRNPVGLDFNPETGQLWAAVNERDHLGDDLPPDYLTSITPGGFYGWPYAYYGPNPDPEYGDQRPDLVRKTLVPDVPIQAHAAALGLAFYTGSLFPEEYRGDAFVALHGSWNRSRRVGYKVIRVDFRNGKPVGKPQDFVSGWLTGEGQVWGRPVGVAVGRDGSLFVSDDGADRIWRVTYRR